MKLNVLIAMTAMATGSLFAKADEIPAGIDNIYLVGEAAPYEWNNGQSQFVKADDGTFYWNGFLRTGQFKMTTDPNDFNSLVSAVQDNETMVVGQPMTMAYNPQDGGSMDYKWYNNVAAFYTLTVNLADATLIVTGYTPSPAIESLVLVGGVVSSGYSLDDAPVLEKNGDIFNYSGELNAGEFKFVINRDGQAWPSIVADSADKTAAMDIPMRAYRSTSTSMKDYKWVISEAGKYDISVDTAKMLVTVSKNEDTDGISAIVADDSAEAVYYNLCGVRVDKPENGIFIRVCNGKASKIAL